MRRIVSLTVLALMATLVGPVGASAMPAQPPSIGTKLCWNATWSASPQRPSASFTPNWSEHGFADHTLRQAVRATTSGAAVRIRLTNTYGTTPLTIAKATVAGTAGGAAVRPGSVRTLTVGNAPTFTIPAGADLATDPVPLPVAALSSITVTVYLAGPTRNA